MADPANEADLTEANLSKADLSGADLRPPTEAQVLRPIRQGARHVSSVLKSGGWPCKKSWEQSFFYWVRQRHRPK
jgi:hypothetical protein